MVIRSSNAIGPDWWFGVSGFLLGVVLLYAVGCYVLSLGGSTYYGYDSAPGFWDLQRNGRVIVKPAIVDHDAAGNYIVGLRLPVRRFECNGGKEFRVGLVNEVHYFVLHMDTDLISEFSSRATFQKELVGLGIDQDVSLDYTEAERRWSRFDRHYGHIDHSMCTEAFEA